MLTHYASSILLIVSFLLAFTIHSIATSSEDSTLVASTDQKGPGGKPLPQSKSQRAKAQRKIQILEFNPMRKLLFTWISFGLMLSFVASAALAISHTVLDRGNDWWCGPDVAVRIISRPRKSATLTDIHNTDLHCGVFLRLHALPVIPD